MWRTCQLSASCNRPTSICIYENYISFALMTFSFQATKSLLDKEAPGLVVAMISSSLKVTPMAMLSRYIIILIIVTAQMYI